MKWPWNVVLALLGILVPLTGAIQTATFSYVVSIERRLTRLESRDELRGPPIARPGLPPTPPARILERKAEPRRVLVVGEAVDDRLEERCEIIARIKCVADQQAERGDRASALRPKRRPPVVTHEPTRVADLGGALMHAR